MLSVRSGMSAVGAANNLIYSIGGQVSGSTMVGTVDPYNPTANTCANVVTIAQGPATVG